MPARHLNGYDDKAAGCMSWKISKLKHKFQFIGEESMKIHDTDNNKKGENKE